MQHRGRAHAGTDIRWAGGQVSKFLVVSKLKLGFKSGVDLVEQFESLLQLQTRAHRLHTQMIFLVNHDAERLPPIHDYGAACTFRRVFATNQMTLDLINSKIAVRSAFLAQPGNARLHRLRASRTRLLITIW